MGRAIILLWVLSNMYTIGGNKQINIFQSGVSLNAVPRILIRLI